MNRRFISRPRSNNQSPYQTTTTIPRDGRLFIHRHGGKYYCCGSGCSYEFDPETFNVLEYRPQPFTQDYYKPFNHFYQAVQHQGVYYCICKGYLCRLQGHALETIAYVPAQCNEKYKIMSHGGNLLCLDDLGGCYMMKGSQLVKQPALQFYGDCYVTSHMGTSVAVSNTQHEIKLWRGGKTHTFKLDEYVTVDFLNAYLCLCHNDSQNMLVDFTTTLQAMSGSSGEEPVPQPYTYVSGRRVKDMEWNRLHNGLQIVDDFVSISNQALYLLMDFDVGGFSARVYYLIYNRAETKSPKPGLALSSNSDPPKEQRLDARGLELSAKSLHESVHSPKRSSYGYMYQLLIIKQQEQIQQLQSQVSQLERYQYFFYKVTNAVLERIGRKGYEELLDDVVRGLIK